MPTVYLRKDLYDSLVERRKDVNAFINAVVDQALGELRQKEITTKSPPVKRGKEA